MKRLLASCWLCVLLSACSTVMEPVVSNTPIRKGMTKQELVKNFGAPLGVIKNPDGSEDWLYNFGGRTTLSSRRSYGSSFDNTQSITTTSETTTILTYEQAPVRINDRGFVTEVPPGKVVIR